MNFEGDKLNELVDEFFPDLDLSEKLFPKSKCIVCKCELDTLFYFYCPISFCNGLMCTRCMITNVTNKKYKIDEMNDICICKKSVFNSWLLNFGLHGKNKNLSNGNLVIDSTIQEMISFWCSVFGNCVFEYLSSVKDRQIRVFTYELCKLGITGIYFCLKNRNIEEAQVLQVYLDFFGRKQFLKEIECSFQKFKDLYTCQAGKILQFKKKTSNIDGCDFRSMSCVNMGRLFLFIDYHYSEKYDYFIETIRSKMGTYLDSRMKDFKREKSIEYMCTRDCVTGELVNLYI